MLRNVDIPQTAETISYWIKQQVETSETKGVVIGLSGGIDSAISAALAVKGLGPEKVHGMIIPCYSSKYSVVHAIEVATQLGISWQQIPLNCIYDGFAEVMPNPGKLAKGNLRSRLRMCVLYTKANELNYLVCGTTNLTEMYTGYFTKYGDGGIDIEPIAALFKCEVREMAKHLNIPRAIIEKPPSADLGISETDEEELGYSYDELDAAVFKMIVGEYIPIDAPGAEGAVRRLYDRTAHKRALPPQCNVLVRTRKYYAIIGGHTAEIIGVTTDPDSVRDEEPDATFREITKEQFEAYGDE